jgi:hypothetical protein
MGRFQFGDYQDIDFRSRNPVLKMESDGFADILIKFVYSGALGKMSSPIPRAHQDSPSLYTSTFTSMLLC